jgi:MYXO-CTERM domain-containing protein
MSSRSILFLAALAALLAVPAASAQGAYTLAIEIQGLPDSASSNGTALVVDFSVRASVMGATPCLSSSGSEYTITLDAELVNSTGNHTQVHVNPKQYTMAGPTLLPAAGGPAERTQEAQLTVYPVPYSGDGLNATVLVTASFSSSSSGCPGVPASSGAEDTATIDVGFTPVPALYGADEAGQEMPAPGAVLLMAALAAAAVVLRRRQ